MFLFIYSTRYFLHVTNGTLLNQIIHFVIFVDDFDPVTIPTYGYRILSDQCCGSLAGFGGSFFLASFIRVRNFWIKGPDLYYLQRS
jgi:hypothetical protein